MPRDYRGSQPPRKTAARRPRQPVTVTRIAPAPRPGTAPTGPLGPYTAEHRAAYFVQGITRPGDARVLHDAGVGPDDVIAWTGAGIPLDGYARMARLSAAGIAPAEYATWAAAGFSDSAVLDLRAAGIDPAEARRWEAARHRPTTCRIGATGTHSCSCPPVGSTHIASLVRYGKDPRWLAEAIDAGCGSAPTAVAVAYKDIPLSLVRVVAARRRSIWSHADSAAAMKEWDKWLASAGGDADLAQAVADAGGRRADLPGWVRAGLPADRVRALAAAGYGPREARSAGVAGLDDEALDVLASLLAMSDAASPPLARVC